MTYDRRMKGTASGGMPRNRELKLEVWDSPTAACVVIDAVRCATLTLDHNPYSALESS